MSHPLFIISREPSIVHRHLRENYYAHSIMTDKEFERTRKVINAKCRSLKKKGLGRKQHAGEGITRDEEQMLFEKNILGKQNPPEYSFFSNSAKDLDCVEETNTGRCALVMLSSKKQKRAKSFLN